MGCTATAVRPEPDLAEAPPPAGVASEAPAPVDDRLEWLLAHLTPDEGAPVLDEATYAQAFTATFTDAVSHGRLAVVLEPMRTKGPWQPACAVQRSETHLQTYVQGPGGAHLITLDVEPAAPHLVSGLWVAPAPWHDQAQALESWAAIDEALAGLGAQVSLLAAEVGPDGALREIHARGAQQSLAIGSAFKLWVLDALAESVQAGERSWDDTLVVRDALRSLSSTHLDKVEDGTEMTLRALAGSMIEVSDNTATDMLVLDLGRPAVEAALPRTAHSEPTRNQPFMTTRDLFWLKVQADEAAVQSYLAADTDGRRAILDAGVPLDLGTAYWKAMSWTAPRHIDSLEWFATAHDLAAVLVALRERASEPVREILTKNPGLPMCGAWQRVHFKGGSEPGVYNVSWLLERDDGRTFVLVITLNDPTTLIPDGLVLAPAFAAAQRLGEVP